VLADGGKAAALLYLAAIVQAAVLNGASFLGGTPDLLLVTLVAVALLRGAIFGAVGGFCAGLVLDVATLQTLGLSSLLLTLAGYWIGRYGETTGRDRAHAPLLAVAVITILYAVAALAVRFVLGEYTDGSIVGDSVFPGVLLNALLAVPVFALGRRLFRAPDRVEGSAPVRLLG